MRQTHAMRKAVLHFLFPVSEEAHLFFKWAHSEHLYIFGASAAVNSNSGSRGVCRSLTHAF